DSDDGIPIDGLEELQRLIPSPWIAERYWLAKATANSRSPQSGKIALSLLDDPQPNVACMALYSLGKQGNPAVIPTIIHKINTSDHWYVQWYAYKALKRLGWRQQTRQEQPK
ncbi:MAG: HEAT repeat domain-containing protein, partial [Desulfosalsimonadaceae bacterium]|nr:HEAT repeat domain-containing protein [Desulfosalsimonadaceae bacterium]